MSHCPDLETVIGSNADEMDEPGVSLLNRSLYYWGFYRQSPFPDVLVAAIAFMQSYRTMGGALHRDTEAAMMAELERIAPAKPAKPEPKPVKQQRPKSVDEIFGHSWEQIEAYQQGWKPAVS